MLVPCACSPSSASWGCANYVTGSEGACIGRGLCCDEAGAPGSRVRRRCLALRTRPPRGTPDCLSWTRPLPPSTDRLLLRCVRRSEKEPLAPAQLLRNPSSTGPARRRPSAPVVCATRRPVPCSARQELAGRRPAQSPRRIPDARPPARRSHHPHAPRRHACGASLDASVATRVIRRLSDILTVSFARRLRASREEVLRFMNSPCSYLLRPGSRGDRPQFP